MIKESIQFIQKKIGEATRSIVAATFILAMAGTTQAQTGSALSFDRINDYVNLGTALTTSLANQNKFTVEAWVRPTVTFTSGAYGTVVGNYSTLNNTPPMQFLLRANNGVWSFFVQTAGSFTAVNSGTFVVNQWQHIAATWDGTVGSIYVNGALSNTASMAGSGFTTATNPVCIGASLLTNEYFGGDIDEVRIWNRVLCPAEISNNMNAELTAGQFGLMAYYKFNQGTAGGNNAGLTTLNDASPNAVNGTLTNFALSGATSNWVTPGGVTNGSLASVYFGGTITVNSGSINPGQTFTINPTGGVNYTYSSGSATVNPNVITNYTVYGYAGGCLNKAVSTVTVNANVIHFDGVDDYINLGTPISNSLSTLNKITVETWVRPNSLLGLASVIGNYATNTTQMQFLIRRQANTAYQFYIGNGVGGNYLSVNSTAVPTVNVWQHVAGTWDGTVASIYVNGILSGTASITYPAMGNIANPIWIGANNINENFNGNVDECRIWNRTLCAGEILNNMNAELTLPQTGLLAYYKLNQGISGGNNAGLTSASDLGPGNVTGTLTNMPVNGLTSNWIAPAGISYGATAPTFTIGGFTVSGSNSICIGSSNTYTASGVNTYTWSTGVNTTTIIVSPTVTTNYNVVGTSTNGCQATILKTLTVNALPTVNISSSSNTICVGNSATLTAGGASTYSWNTGANASTVNVSPTVTTNYTATGTSSLGCSSNTVFTQVVDLCTGIQQIVNGSNKIVIYPNPSNGDFYIETSATITLNIYNALGKLVLSKTGVEGKININMNEFGKGLYLINAIEENKPNTFRLIVE